MNFSSSLQKCCWRFALLQCAWKCWGFFFCWRMFLAIFFECGVVWWCQLTFRWFAAVAAFKVNQYGLSTKRLLMIFRWKSDTAAIAQLPPVSGSCFYSIVQVFNLISWIHLHSLTKQLSSETLSLFFQDISLLFFQNP